MTDSTHVSTAVSTGSLSTEKVTYKAFVKLAEDGTVDKIAAKAETADGKNWEKMEKEGWLLFNENSFTRYTVKDESGFHHLVKDPKQRMYIIQAGLNYVQNAGCNQYSVEIQDGTNTKEVTAVPAHNGEEIDLIEHINTPTERRSLTAEEKLARLVASLNLPADQVAALLAHASKNLAVQTEDEVSA